MLAFFHVAFSSVGFDKTFSTVLETYKANEGRIRPEFSQRYLQSACALSWFPFFKDERLHCFEPNVHNSEGEPYQHTFTVRGHSPPWDVDTVVLFEVALLEYCKVRGSDEQ